MENLLIYALIGYTFIIVFGLPKKQDKTVMKMVEDNYDKYLVSSLFKQMRF